MGQLIGDAPEDGGRIHALPDKDSLLVGLVDGVEPFRHGLADHHLARGVGDQGLQKQPFIAGHFGRDTLTAVGLRDIEDLFHVEAGAGAAVVPLVLSAGAKNGDGGLALVDAHIGVLPGVEIRQLGGLRHLRRNQEGVVDRVAVKAGLHVQEGLEQLAAALDLLSGIVQQSVDIAALLLLPRLVLVHIKGRELRLLRLFLRGFLLRDLLKQVIKSSHRSFLLPFGFLFLSAGVTMLQRLTLPALGFGLCLKLCADLLHLLPHRRPLRRIIAFPVLRHGCLSRLCWPGGRRGPRGFLRPAQSRVFGLHFLLRGICHQRIQEYILLAALRPGLLRHLLFLCTGSLGTLDLAADGCHIHRGELEAFKNAIHFACVLGPNHYVGDPIRGVPIFEHAVENAVFFRFTTELHEVLILHSEHFEFLPAAEHIGESRLALGLLLVFQDGIEQERNFLCSRAGDLGGDFNAFQAHSDDLLRCVP